MSQRNERSRRPDLAHWLIHQAARRAPDTLSARLEEEWFADLESRSAVFSRLCLALGCCWATLVIANDNPRVRAPVASPAAPANGIVTLVERNFGYFSLRSATLFLIAGLHAALFFGLITTLSHTRSPAAAAPNLQNREVTPPPEKAAFTLDESELNHWRITVPKTVVDPPAQPAVASDVIADVSDQPAEVISQPVPPETPAHVVRQLAGGPGEGFPETADFYPSLSIHLEEEGLSTVRVCVDRRGRLTSEPTTAKGSGSARLDQAALKLARAGSGHYRASTEDGEPVNSCYAFGVRFQLRK